MSTSISRVKLSSAILCQAYVHLREAMSFLVGSRSEFRSPLASRAKHSLNSTGRAMNNKHRTKIKHALQQHICAYVLIVLLKKLSCLPPISMAFHSVCNFDEASNVATSHQAWKLTLLGLDILLSSCEAVLEA